MEVKSLWVVQNLPLSIRLLSSVLDVHETKTVRRLLHKLCLKLDDKEEVKVQLQPEPENKFNSKATAFQGFISDEWHRIGYIVKEALDDVHSAPEQNAITSIEFAWAKYLLTWTKSGPGYFAGIKITRK